MADNDHDFGGARKMLDKKGLAAAMRDGSVRPMLNAADKLDIQRKAFLQALAMMCAAAEGKGVPKKTIIECLKGAADGMEHA